MADMINKTVLFLAVNGLDGKAFEQLWNCFGNLNASTRIASFIADEEISDFTGFINTHSDMSFKEATELDADVVVIADAVTANAIKDDLPAKTVLMNAFENNAAIVSVNEGAIALIGAGIVDGKTIAATPDLAEALENAGAQLADESMAISNNIFSANRDANLRLLCEVVSEDLSTRRPEAA